MSKISTKKNILSDTKMNKDADNASDFPYEPGDNIISNILNYSKALSIRKSKRMEHFEMVLN
jgi:hypothetical protein